LFRCSTAPSGGRQPPLSPKTIVAVDAGPSHTRERNSSTVVRGESSSDLATTFENRREQTTGRRRRQTRLKAPHRPMAAERARNAARPSANWLASRTQCCMRDQDPRPRQRNEHAFSYGSRTLEPRNKEWTEPTVAASRAAAGPTSSRSPAVRFDDDALTAELRRVALIICSMLKI
jgi:hypothetical protein